MGFSRLGALSAVLLAGATPAFAGRYHYTLLDMPNLGQVQPRAINDEGVVVGVVVPASGQGAGFVWAKGTLSEVAGVSELDSINSNGIAAGLPSPSGGSTYVTYDVAKQSLVPHMVSTTENVQVTNIADNGVVFGGTCCTVYAGFEADKNKVKLIKKNKQRFDAFGLDNTGAIVGGYSAHIGTHVFSFTKGAVTFIDPPGSQSAICGFVTPSGIVGGQFDDTTGFIKDGSTYTSVAYPGANATSLVGIGAAGEIVGFQEPSGSKAKQSGFVLVDGNFYDVNPKGSALTQVTAVNANGDLIGYYFDQSYTYHAFIATCAADQQPCTQ